MMDIVMFAIVGSIIDASAGYWITYGIFAGLKVCIAVINAMTDK